MQTPFEKLASELSKLFELEKADLDFGIHRIIKARQRHIRIFLGLDEPPADDPHAPTLKKIVQREMGELNTVELERQLEATAEKIRTDYGKLAFSDSMLVDGPPKESGDGQLWLALKEELDSGEEKANVQLEAEIYSHLTEFFSRYYDEADFLSKRRIKAGDAPYAVPYSGEEVLLHWANKDQYYIKSSKDLKDYTFTLPERFGTKRVQFKCERQDPVLNNNNAKREFHLDVDADGNPKIETTKDAARKEALVIGFHFKLVDKTRTQPETKAWIEHLLELLPSAEWRAALSHVPAGAKTNLLTRHLTNYTRKNESDFFIHKQLGHFLRGELDFYIKNEVMHLDDIDEKSTDYLTTRVRLIKALRTIAHQIIRFLAQLENFQKKLWLKKKYVTETQYCFTLDRVFALGEPGEALIKTLLDHVDDQIRRYDGEMRSQHEEWIKLYAIDDLEDYPEDGKLTLEFLRAHDKLMLDTRFYPSSFKWRLLGAMEDLETQMDGFLVQSENFQALNLLKVQHSKRVKCVYIDPPYNAKSSEILYKNSYRDSSWLSLINDRILASIPMLREDTVFVVAIDEVEQELLGQVLSQHFPDHEKSCIAVNHNPSGQQGDNFSFTHEYAYFIYPKPGRYIAEVEREDESEWDERNFRDVTGNDSFRAAGPNCFYPILIKDNRIVGFGDICDPDHHPEMNEAQEDGITAVYPIDPEGEERKWRFARGTVERVMHELKVHYIRSRGVYDIKRLKKKFNFKSNWVNSKYSANNHGTQLLNHIIPDASASYPKSLYTVGDCLLAALNGISDAQIIDFFAGSGTTAHAVISLNRKDQGKRGYTLVEMGDHFDTVLKPRIQRVIYSADWRDGKPTTLETGISHGFKYLRLESYEDALNNLDLGEDRAPDLLGLGDQVREDFLFSYLLDVETRGHLLNLDRFRDPWGCQLKIHDPHTGRGEARVVDLVETFNYLLGVTVREIRVQGTKDKPDAFLTIEGENSDGQTILILWRRLEGNPDVDERHRVEWPVSDNEDLKAFAATNRGIARGLNPADTEFHAIYINGDHTLADPNSKIHCIEEVFYERMFANTGSPED